jgi:hypothetical protein
VFFAEYKTSTTGVTSQCEVEKGGKGNHTRN